MKLKEKTGCYNMLVQSGKFSNDGHGTLYIQEPPGVQYAISTKEAAHIVAKWLKDKAGFLLFYNDAKALAIDLRESVDIGNEKLAEFQPHDYLACKNGIIDMRMGKLVEHPPNGIYIKNFADFEFREGVSLEGSVWQSFIHTSLNADIRRGKVIPDKVRLLGEFLLNVLCAFPNNKKLMIILGPPHAGKSVVLQFIRGVMRPGSWVPLSLADLTQQFRVYLLENRQAVISDELCCGGVKHLDILKKIIAGEDIIIEAKGEQAIPYKPHARLLYAANSLPELGERDSGNAFADRLAVLKFPNTLSTAQWDLGLVDKLLKERNVFLSYIVQNIAPAFVQRNFAFTKDNDGEEALRSYKQENDSVKAFIEDAELCVRGEQNEAYLGDVYEAYTKFCKVNMVRPFGARVFRSQLVDMQFSFEKKRLGKDRTSRSCVLGLKLKGSGLIV